MQEVNHKKSLLGVGPKNVFFFSDITQTRPRRFRLFTKITLLDTLKKNHSISTFTKITSK